MHVWISERSDGETLAVRVGDSIHVELADNPTTGYRWELETCDDDLLVVEEASFARRDERVGSGGMAIWVLRAATPGVTRLVARRWRPWEGEAGVLARLVVRLEIQ